MPEDDPIDLLALHLIHARMRSQKSRALPQEQYSDPANSVKFKSEKKREKKSRKPNYRFK